MSFTIPAVVKAALADPGADMRWTATIQLAGESSPKWEFTTNGHALQADEKTYMPGIMRVTPWATSLCNVGQPPRASVLIADANDAVRASIENVPPENAAVTCGVTFLVTGAWTAPFSIVKGVIADAATKEFANMRCTELTIAARLFATASNPQYLLPGAVTTDALAKQDLQSGSAWRG